MGDQRPNLLSCWIHCLAVSNRNRKWLLLTHQVLVVLSFSTARGLDWGKGRKLFDNSCRILPKE